MPSISNQFATAAGLPAATAPSFIAKSGHSAEEVREHFTQFVGETFFGQMLKSMRQTVGKPAYFNGGRAEEVFRGQLDQKMAEEMTKSSADRFAEPMFAHQFPRLAKQLEQEKVQSASSHLNGLAQLGRR